MPAKASCRFGIAIGRYEYRVQQRRKRRTHRVNDLGEFKSHNAKFHRFSTLKYFLRIAGTVSLLVYAWRTE